MKKTAFILMILTIVSKIFGFAKTMVLSYYYGASNISDAYLISLTIPSVIFGIVGVALSTSYIPIYSEIDQKYGVDKSNKYTSNLINIIILISTVIFIFGQVFTEQIVKLFAYGFEEETLVLAVQFTKISLIGIYITGIVYIFSGLLQVKGNYSIPALIRLPLNTFIMIAIFLSSKTNIIVLSIGSLFAFASQLILLIPYTYKNGYRYNLFINFKDKYIKKMAIMALPVIIGVSVDQINVLIDKSIASNLAIGGISALNYASSLNAFVQGIFITSLSVAMYPMISKMAIEKDLEGLKDMAFDAINTISILVIPATIGAMIFSVPIVKFLFGRGEFDSYAITMTSISLFYYSIAMLAFGYREILARVFYSLQDTKTPMINGMFGVITNIILNLILSRYMGIGGLALATSISTIICAILLLISLRKKIGPLGMKKVFGTTTKILVASLIMGVIAKVLQITLIKFINESIALIFAIGIGAISYFVIVYFMKIDEVDKLTNIIKKKIRN